MTAALGLSACKTQFPAEENVDVGDPSDTGDELGDPTGDSEPDPTTETGATFVPDVGPGIVPCDPWAQDCGDGEKCVPYASTGGNWDANRCVPIMGDGQVGDSCTWGGVVEATDSCGAESHCWDVMDIDGQLEGVCTAFCEGNPDNPTCAPASSCLIANEGSITLCVASCDPLAQDCGDGLGCFWSSNDFQCIFTAGDILEGEPCGYLNDCAPGLRCEGAELLPECNGTSCCTSFCDLTGDGCSNPATECVPFFEEGTAPPTYEDVGLCVIPGA